MAPSSGEEKVTRWAYHSRPSSHHSTGASVFILERWTCVEQSAAPHLVYSQILCNVLTKWQPGCHHLNLLLVVSTPAFVSPESSWPLHQAFRQLLEARNRRYDFKYTIGNSNILRYSSGFVRLGHIHSSWIRTVYYREFEVSLRMVILYQ